MQDPIVCAELFHLGATLIVTALPGFVGDCDPLTRVIRVAQGMTPAETRCTIMHEAGHLALGHVPTGEDHVDDLMEAAANRWAAAKLITDSQLDWALRVARDRREAAEMLQVDPETLDARVDSIPVTRHSGLVLVGSKAL